VINHCVLVRPGAKKVSRIISHEQALKQCKKTLNRVCPGAILEPFKDTALAAKKLAEGEFDDTTAVLAPETAAEYYGLEILHNGVQDLGKDNITDFLVLSNRL
jgi:prephenate dehydratase